MHRPEALTSIPYTAIALSAPWKAHKLPHAVFTFTPRPTDTDRSREERSRSGKSGQKEAAASSYSQGAVTVKGPLVRVKQPQLLANMGPQMLSRVRGTNDDDDDDDDDEDDEEEEEEEEVGCSWTMGGIARGEGEGARGAWMVAGLETTESARSWVAMAPSTTRLIRKVEKTRLIRKVEMTRLKRIDIR